jgi:hypothetical protein
MQIGERLLKFFVSENLGIQLGLIFITFQRLIHLGDQGFSFPNNLGGRLDLALSWTSLTMAKSVDCWGCVAFAPSRPELRVEANQAVDRPVQVFNGSTEHLTLGVGLHRGGPPRRRHNNSEQTRRSGDIQPSPVLPISVLTGVWPLFGDTPLWLATSPPDNPLLLELLDVGNRGREIASLCPGDDHFRALL